MKQEKKCQGVKITHSKQTESMCQQSGRCVARRPVCGEEAGGAKQKRSLSSKRHKVCCKNKEKEISSRAVVNKITDSAGFGHHVHLNSEPRGYTNKKGE